MNVFTELHFQTDEYACAFVEKVRGPEGQVSPLRRDGKAVRDQACKPLALRQPALL